MDHGVDPADLYDLVMLVGTGSFGNVWRLRRLFFSSPPVLTLAVSQGTFHVCCCLVFPSSPRCC
jgi:hypothetical protein